MYEKIKNIRGNSTQKNDVTAYVDKSDSLLTEKQPNLTFEPS